MSKRKKPEEDPRSLAPGSSIPVTPEVVMATLAGFTMRPVNGDDTYEQMSIGVAQDSVVATDGQSAILIGINAGSHVATQRKEVVIEATRATQYSDIFRIDDVARNLSSAGEEQLMPNVENVIRSGLAGMKHLATINPKALASICKVANAANVRHVDFFQPEGQPDRLGFEFDILPEERHTSLFRSWEGPIKVRGLFVVTKADFDADRKPDVGEDAIEIEVETTERKTGRRKKVQTTLSAAIVELIEGTHIEWADTEEVRSHGSWSLPGLRLLAPIDDTVADAGDFGREIGEVLRSFNLAGRVVASHTGPTVTMYEIEVPAGTQVARYIKLADDLQTQLGVKSLTVSLLPGKKTLGIEIPNKVPRVVRLLEVCGTKAFVDSTTPLLVAIGLGTDGIAIYGDLSAMPHLLVGGATNSGKSIGIATMLCSLVLRNTPDEVRLVLIDPKRVEFTLFEGLPHLMCPVVTDIKDVGGVLQACVREMDKRYDLLQAAGVRNILAHNVLPDVKAMPYIVIVIDELADLMLQCGAEVESSIVRLTQLARAVGIHVVVGTQRPSVDVVTGLIKANIPSRISFNVATGVDSKVILDSTGAEKLLGKGDMLYFPIGANKPTRIQGAYASESEIKDLCNAWRRQKAPEFEILLEGQEPRNSPPPQTDGDIDPLYDDAAAWVRQQGQASTSMLQRKFSIGFQRAMRLLYVMEERGVVAPQDGTTSCSRVLPYSISTVEELDKPITAWRGVYTMEDGEIVEARGEKSGARTYSVTFNGLVDASGTKTVKAPSKEFEQDQDGWCLRTAQKLVSDHKGGHEVHPYT